VNSDVEFISELLREINSAFPFTGDSDTGKDWVLDANASWTPAVARAFIEVIRPYKRRIYMIEQPFPLDFLSNSDGHENLADWASMRRAYNDDLQILLFADESMCTAEDVIPLLPYVNGVNVKLEKAGGFRGAISALEKVSLYYC